MFINKDITETIIKYLTFREKILLSKINEEFNKYIKETLGKLYYLIDDIKKMSSSSAIREIIFPYNKDDGHELFKRYNNGKIIIFYYTFWSSLEENINKFKYDEEVEGIYIEDLDRGVRNWKLLDNLLRKKFPNYKNIYVNQMHGSDNLSESKCELIFLYTYDSTEVNLKNLIYSRILYHSTYEDYIDDPKTKTYINVLKVNNQIQVIMGDDVEIII